jgi:hypothetical protein
MTIVWCHSKLSPCGIRRLASTGGHLSAQLPIGWATVGEVFLALRTWQCLTPATPEAADRKSSQRGSVRRRRPFQVVLVSLARAVARPIGL